MLNRDNDARSRHLSGTRGYSLFLRPKNGEGLFVDNSYATEARFEIFWILDFCPLLCVAMPGAHPKTQTSTQRVNNNADTKSQKSE
jgi:hypothetical protein